MKIKAESLNEQAIKYMANVYNKYPIGLVKGQGVHVYDEKGKKYLDFMSGLGVNILGHSNPLLVDSMTKQIKELVHTSNLFNSPLPILLSKALTEKFPDSKVYFSNSGAEANECAIKVARYWGQRQACEKHEIVSFGDAFHGRTMATISASPEKVLHRGFEPLLPGFRFARYNDISSVRREISDATCAILIETIQGTGGLNVAKREFMRQVGEICKERNILLILDEIQTGMGRTGKFFSYEDYDVTPDIITIGKPLGGGLPLAATLIENAVAAYLTPGIHGSTFGGNPVACSAGLKIIEFLNEANLRKMRAIGEYLNTGLDRIVQRYPALVARRLGKALMCGIELRGDARRIVNECVDKGLIATLVQNRIVRMLPPYIITEADVDTALSILDNVLVRTGD